ncbi:MAG: PBP1A family penicillin-binding protein [Candidatus Melainabacteria bacterium]
MDSLVNLIKNLISLAILGSIVLAGLFGLYFYKETRNLPPVEKMIAQGINPSKWTQVFAADETPILSYGKFHHKDVPLDKVSPHFVEALLATEDRRFYQHHGVDPIAIARAVVRNIVKRSIREGGSTLTQQLARNVFLSSERSMTRKLREAALAIHLENELSKQEILTLYVNNTYFGEGAYGIEAASEIFFNKKPSQLSVEEAALLAGLPQAPSRYNPFQNPETARARRNEVLANLMEVGKIDADSLKTFQNKPLRLNAAGRGLSISDKAPYFNRYVMDQVMKHFDLDEQGFWNSGLKIYTTLDPKAQRLADRAINTQSAAFGRTGAKQQASLVSLDTKTGGILAYSGGKNYQQSQFDRVTTALRSPGSLFKVFTYTTAIDQGMEPGRQFVDEPITIDGWTPTNYDKSHHGAMSIADALVHSNNIIAVKVLMDVTPNAVVETAHRMGIRSNLNPYPALTLGGSSVNLLEITSAIGVLANQGVRVEPYAIDRIVDSDSKLIYRHQGVKADVLSRTTVDTMVKMMEGVVLRGTGHGANIGRPVAGKTGTSDDHRDAWFVGFTPSIVTGVWVGNDDNSAMSAITGGSMPARIWREIMQPYLSDQLSEDFDLPYARDLTENANADYDDLTEDENAVTAEDTPGEPAEGELQPLDGSDPVAPLQPVQSLPVNPAAPVNNGPPVPDTPQARKAPRPKYQGYQVIPIEPDRRQAPPAGNKSKSPNGEPSLIPLPD